MVNKLPFLRFLPALFWAGIIFALSTNNPAHLPKIQFLSWDKLGHFVFYFILTGLLFWAIYNPNPKSAKHELIAAISVFFCASLYGMSLEFVQARLPYRSFDYADMLANCVGAFFALILYYIRKRRTIKYF